MNQMLNALLAIMVVSTAVSASETAVDAPLVQADGWLKSQIKPSFRPGYTLPRLSRFGWILSYDTRVELAGNWGYGLEFGSAGEARAEMSEVEEALNNPESESGRILALAASEPDIYPLAVLCSRSVNDNDLPEETWTKDKDGKFVGGKNVYGEDGASSGEKIWSPEAPAETLEIMAKLWADPIAKLRARARIAIVLNGGEYGLGVIGFHQKDWEKDPRILAGKGRSSWFDYISRQKAKQEIIISDALRKAVPDRELYVFYFNGSIGRRNQYPNWASWGWDFEQMEPISDVPGGSFYYKHYNTGWDGQIDLLTIVTNSFGYQIARGFPLSYNWLCGGWGRGEKSAIREGDISSVERYTGFLKCLYTLGQIGGNAGYYSLPPGSFTAQFEPDAPPEWLLQMTALSQVHAMWSWLEHFSHEGEALPGPAKHIWAKDQPAYELRTGDVIARVVGRKLKDEDEWILTGWASDGEAREVKVTVPELGEVALLCRPAGSVYHGTLKDGQPVLKLLDEDALAPASDPATLANLKSVSRPSPAKEKGAVEL